jgi:very-short-patch-repair endonuclease
MKQQARHLRRNQTDAEKLLWYKLRNRQLNGHKFRRQHPIPPYVVDLVCVEKQLITEVDGGQHMERSRADKSRDTFLEQQGYRVVRFWNNEVLQQTDEVPLTLPSPHDGERVRRNRKHSVSSSLSRQRERARVRAR